MKQNLDFSWLFEKGSYQDLVGNKLRQRILIFFLLIFIFTACSLDPNEQFIQGTWEITQTGAGNKFFQWRFDNGAFTREQEIDRTNSLYTTGRYRVMQSEGYLLVLEISSYSGDRISYENNPMAIKIEIDRENDTAQITNVLFFRVGP